MERSDNRRGKVTPEHLEEARRLRAIWNQKKPELARNGVGTQEAFGDRYGIGNQAAVGFFLNGKTALSAKAAAGFARGLGVPIAAFSPRLAALLETPAPTGPAAAPVPLNPAPRAPAQRPAESLLEQLARALRDLPELQREDVARLLGSLARSGGDAVYVAALSAFLGHHAAAASGKRTGTAG